MKKFLLGVLAGFVLAGLTAVIVFFAFVRLAASFGDRPTAVADGSTLVLRLEGEVPEKAPAEAPLPFLEQHTPVSVQQLWETLHKAAVDPRIKAIVFEPRGVSIGWAKMQEIRQELEDFRKSGKPLISFLRNPGAREYYLASATDKIYMVPEDMLDLKGLRVEALYLKGSLDKLGVKVDVIHAGKYKDAGDILTQTSMSGETREVLNQVLDQFYGNLADTIAAGRKKQPAEVRALVDRGPFMASQALASGLVDSLAFEDQVGEELRKRLNQSELKKVSLKNYLKTQVSGAAGSKRIALIVGEGEITRGSGDTGFGSDEGITSGGFNKLLREVENDSSIKGAIIRVNSPGGDGIASDDILHEAKNLSKKKPVVISMSDLAASGGYFISMTGDPIVAYSNTLTGSIGVIFGKINLHGLYDKLGMNKELLTRGHYADLDSDYAPLTDEDRQKLREEIDAFYKGFVSRVAEGRKRTYDQMEPLAQGRVWLGSQAKQNGLVDEIGGLDRAIELVKQRAQIPAGEKILLITYPPRKSFIEKLMARSNDNTVNIDTAMSKLLTDFPVRAWTRGGFLKVMPYTITVR